MLLEAASSGRPVLATSVPGCIETFEPNISGIAFKPHDYLSLVSAIESFVDMDHGAKERMGRAGREKILREFDRRIIIDKYCDEIRKTRKIDSL